MKPATLIALLGILWPALLCTGQDMDLSFSDADWQELRPSARRGKSLMMRTPAMLGDFWQGSPLRFHASETRDRLIVLADELDTPGTLPAGTSTLMLSEPGPVGIFSSNLQSIQQLQALLRSGSPLPGATQVGNINSPATLTTISTVAQIQQQLASTPQAYDIVLLQAPPGAYGSAVQAMFIARNGGGGIAQFDAASSGAILQGGIDSLTGAEDFDAYYFYDYVVRVDTALTDATSGGVGRMKIADGGTVLPQDRFFVRYNYADAVRYSNSGVRLNRFVPGFERSLANGLASFELRAPIAANTVGSYTYDAVGLGADSTSRFGNLSLFGKLLLLQREQMAISGGLGVALPTATDTRMNFANGTPLAQISNESVRLMPFLATLYMPTSDWFLQSFVQYDVAANGNRVAINTSGTGLQPVGTLTERSTLSFDTGLGCWLYRSDRTSGITGVIPMVELHHNLAVGNADQVAAGRFVIGDYTSNYSQTNLTSGISLELAQRANLSAGYIAPLGNGVDRGFDGAFQVYFATTR